MTLMEWLMLATGVSGTFTFVWLFGIVHSWFVRPPSLEVHAGVGLLDRLLREIAAARREILFCTDMLENPSVAEALLTARSRGVRVEILHGTVAEVYSGSTLNLFIQHQLIPLIDDHSTRIACHACLMDGRTLLLASGPFHAEEEQSAGGAYLLRVQQMPEVLGAFRELFSGLRTRSRPARSCPVDPIDYSVAPVASSTPSTPSTPSDPLPAQVTAP
ncbi:MAG: hypothetical protein SNJ82_04795, partial [Gemmataceae bacterium]